MKRVILIGFLAVGCGGPAFTGLNAARLDPEGGAGSAGTGSAGAAGAAGVSGASGAGSSAGATGDAGLAGAGGRAAAGGSAGAGGSGTGGTGSSGGSAGAPACIADGHSCAGEGPPCCSRLPCGSPLGQYCGAAIGHACGTNLDCASGSCGTSAGALVCCYPDGFQPCAAPGSCPDSGAVTAATAHCCAGAFTGSWSSVTCGKGS